MRYRSTRDDASTWSLSEALRMGLAPDGGLFVPAGELPSWEGTPLRGGEEGGRPDVADLRRVGVDLLRPFFAGDRLEGELEAIVEEAFDFDAPLVRLDEHTSVLELFHGPSAAFKDFGARFLAACLSRLATGLQDAVPPSRSDGFQPSQGSDGYQPSPGSDGYQPSQGSDGYQPSMAPYTVLVATSGDTGGAVAAAFWRKPNVEVVVLYPKGRVSPRQEKQLTAWGDNVRTFAVEGAFDDCQRMVKQAFADPWFQQELRLTSANSINIGRLLPQAVYYAAAAQLHHARTGRPLDVVVPTGNVGNATACIWARKMGLPIGRIVLATNANRPIPDYLESGQWRPRDSVETLATAMDVGNPSNMERLRHLFPTVEAMREAVEAEVVDDDTIRRTIGEGWQRYGQIWCPHTACAAAARARRDPREDWTIVATAHPAKFPEIVEPLVDQEVEIPPTLQAILDRPGHVITIEADLDALRRGLSGD